MARETEATGGGPGSDTTAIHVDQSGEIAGIAAKAFPVGADLLVIEDSADSNAKKRIPLNSIPGIGGFTQGSIPFADALGGLIEDNANLFWDDANNRLGIGITAPAVDLHVSTPLTTDTTRIYCRNAQSNATISQAASGDTAAGTAFGLSNNGLVKFVAFNDTGFALGTLGATDLSLGTNDVVAITVDGTTQFVGVGTTDPKELLHLLSGGTSAYVDFPPRGLLITGDVDTRVIFENLAASAGNRVMMMRLGGTSQELIFSSAIDTGSSFDVAEILALHRDGPVAIGALTTTTDQLRIVASAPVTNTLDLSHAIPANADVLLRLSTERAWTFRQRGSGSGTDLNLHSEFDSKNFVITSPAGTVLAEFRVNDSTPTDSFVALNGHDLRVAGPVRAGGVAFAATTTTAVLGFFETYACTDTTAPRTLTISTADIAKGSVANPWRFIVKDESGGATANNITLLTQGSETIDGVDPSVTPVVIDVDFGVARLYSNGSNLFFR